MALFKNITDYNIQQPAVVTIGTYDGVHAGHKNIIKTVVDTARDKGLTSTLLTFFPHPRMVLQPDSDLKLIDTIEERCKLLFNNGIENIISHPFSKEFARTSARDYVKEILVDQLKAQIVVIGYDHRFGNHRKASIRELKEYALEYNFKVIEISKKEVDAVAVSSTKIRQAISNGKMETAAHYLSRPFYITGLVIHGKKIGRTIGYPTANLKITQDYKLLPKNGVYITSAVIDEVTYHGMTNIGINPTVDHHHSTKIETYFFNLDKDLYDRELKINFHKRLRDELKFESVDKLKAAMKEDELKARNYVLEME